MCHCFLYGGLNLYLLYIEIVFVLVKKYLWQALSDKIFHVKKSLATRCADHVEALKNVLYAFLSSTRSPDLRYELFIKKPRGLRQERLMKRLTKKNPKLWLV